MNDPAARAAQAKYLLDDPLLTEVLDEIEKAAVSAWLQTGVGMEAEREFAFHAAKAVGRVRETLKSVIDNGLVAAARAVRPLGKP